MGHDLDEEKDDRGTVCVKYLLFLFNFFFWIGGAAVIAMGLWTLMEKSNYIAFLANSTLSVSAYILLFAGGVVMVTGFLGCCALIREQKTCLLVLLNAAMARSCLEMNRTGFDPKKFGFLRTSCNSLLDAVAEPTNIKAFRYLAILISVYTAELAAGVLSYMYYETISEELRESLNETIVHVYGQPGMKDITYAIDHLQQDGGCMTILEEFIQEHLLLIGAVSIGIACFQLAGVMLSACFLHVLYKEEKEAYNAM